MSSIPETGVTERDDPIDRELIRLLGDVDDLLDRLSAAEATWSDYLAAVDPGYGPSARNIVHYWGIRQYDLRDLQRRLAAFGLSSLGRSEPHVEAMLRLVRCALVAMLEDTWRPPEASAVAVGEGQDLLRRHTIELLGLEPAYRDTRIMVTLPSEAATDSDLIRDLLQRGMNVARINCAHDDAEAWRAMADHVRRASEVTGRGCLVAMDLGGPKLRTGPLAPGPRVVKLRPERDALGRVTSPARAWLTPAEHPDAAPDAGMPVLPVPGQWLARRRAADVITLRDTRGARRRLLLTHADTDAVGLVATTDKTTYLATGVEFQVEHVDDPAELGLVPERAQSIRLRRGDELDVTRDCSPAPVSSDGVPAIGCTLAEVFDSARIGDKIYFNDGRIGGEIIAAGADVLRVRIEHATAAGSRLRAGKGINVPDTNLEISALTDKDVEDLATVAQIADIVQLSFVQAPSDIAQLHAMLDTLGGSGVGVVLKVETRRAFERLPQLLLAAMRQPRVGVMIARGDLAVEVGYQRLAEVQEEILWLCEAAHLPVIWATQVLEQLAKTGLPSRAEISDAAMGGRAECVMLNKGPHIGEAVTVLDDILCRMTKHHYKKNALLRQLQSWHPTPTRVGDSSKNTR